MGANLQPSQRRLETVRSHSGYCESSGDVSVFVYMYVGRNVCSDATIRDIGERGATFRLSLIPPSLLQYLADGTELTLKDRSQS